MPRPLHAFILLALCALPARAAEAPAAPAGPLPFNVEAEQSLEYQQEQRVYIARGHAKVTRAEFSVMGDTLTAFERDKPDAVKPADNVGAAGMIQGGGSEIWKFSAEGNVVISNGKAQAYGDHADYDIDTQVAVLTGRNLKLVSAADVLTARDRFEYDGAAKKATAIGHAKAMRRMPPGGVQGTRTIYADRMTTYFVEDKATGKNLVADHIDAEGHVRVVSENKAADGKPASVDIVTGDRGTYNLAAGNAVLHDNVKITRGPNQLEGDGAEVDFKTGVSKLLGNGGTAGGHGRVRGLLVPGAAGMKKPGA